MVNFERISWRIKKTCTGGSDFTPDKVKKITKLPPSFTYFYISLGLFYILLTLFSRKKMIFAMFNNQNS